MVNPAGIFAGAILIDAFGFFRSKCWPDNIVAFSEAYVMKVAPPPRTCTIDVGGGLSLGHAGGELQKMKWEQIDWSASEVKLAGRQTKNKRPRTAQIHGELPGWLEMAKDQRDEFFPTCPWVFSRNGQPIGDFRKVWKPACNVAGVPGLLFHDLRRSAIRNMERAGIPRNVAMAISGHRTESVYSRYDIVSPRDMQDARGRMEGCLDAQRTRITQNRDSKNHITSLID